MRPIAEDQDVIRYPLNELLGTRANVRLMRVLAEEVIGPIGASVAAERTGLTLAGARRALVRLVKTGFVESVGGGRSQKYVLRDSDSLTKTIRQLFLNEAKRYREFRTGIRDALQDLSEIQAAWIDSPPNQVGKPLQIGILSDSSSLAYLGDEVRKRLTKLEQEFDVTIEIRKFSPADVPEAYQDGAELLTGYIDTGEMNTDRTHSQRDERTLRYSSAIADILDSDPSLIRRASRYLEFLLEENQGTASHDIREWHDILNSYSKQRIKDFIIAETPRAKRLRQSSPFLAVLNPDEREKVTATAENSS